MTLILSYIRKLVFNRNTSKSNNVNKAPTGRTHQIRVHLGHIGHRLYGDTQYAGPLLEGLQRQALHAFRLSLAHPITGEWLTCSAEWPADLDAALQALGLRYNESLLPALA